MNKTLIVLCTMALLVSCRRQDVPEPRVTPVSRELGIHEDGPWGSANAGVQCSITCSRQVVTPSKPADLILRVRNQGNATVQYHITNCDGPTYQIKGSWANGTALQFSDLEQQEHHPCGVTNWISLGVGETNKHILSITAGTFMGDECLFVGAEFGSPIKQYGVCTMKLKLMDIESNTLELNVEKRTP